MAQYLEFISNHPFLSAAAVALIFIIISYEVRRATRGYGEVEAIDAPRLINHEDAVLVDTRSVDDFRKSRILNAISLPAGEVKDKVTTLDKYRERPVIVYCGTGINSGRVAGELAAAGLPRVYNLKGGLTAWESAGLPVVRDRK